MSAPAATALISGGSVASVSSHGLGAVATVTGGSDLYSFVAQGEGTVNVVGSSFAVNGEPVGFGEIPASYGKTGTLTGVLQSGQAFSVLFTREVDTGDPSNPIITGKIVLIPAPPPDCLDSLDNDEDGLIDYPNDPGCADADDLSERSPLLVCDDGIDNDGDGMIDSPADPGCFNPFYFAENPQCQDGVNNDPAQDGWIDFDGGASAGVPPEWQTDPDPQCANPWQNRESSCGLGAELALLMPPLMWLYRRRSRRV